MRFTLGFAVGVVLGAYMGVFLGSTAHAATLPATPATLAAQLAASKPGDTVTAGPGAYVLSLRDFARGPAVLLKADKAAVFTAVDLRNVTGLTLAGGEYRAKTDVNGNWGAAIFCHPCSNVTLDGVSAIGPERAIEGEPYVAGHGYGLDAVAGAGGVRVWRSRFVGFKVGVVISRLTGFDIDGNFFDRMSADGIDVSAWGGNITNNVFTGTRIIRAEHPDFIQLWSDLGQAPVSDINITGNRGMAEGAQGISLFDHAKGGFDRIVIEDNDLTIGAGDGISAVSCRACTIRRNQVRGWPKAPAHADIHTGNSPGVRRCDNTVADSAGKKGLTDPTCGIAPALAGAAPR